MALELQSANVQNDVFDSLSHAARRFKSRSKGLQMKITCRKHNGKKGLICTVHRSNSSQIQLSRYH